MENAWIISRKIFAAALHDSTPGATVRQQAGPLRPRLRAGELLVPGSTGTNVMDIQVMLIGGAL